MSGISPTAEAVRFPVRGMTCGSCVNRITRAVRRLDGVTRVDVDLGGATATVRREPALGSNAALAAAVAAAGYEADMGSLTVVPIAETHGFFDRTLGRRG